PAAPAQHHVDLLLRLVRVAVGEATAGRDALVAEAGFLEPERHGGQAELQVGRAVEARADVLEVVLDVLARERHGANPMGLSAPARPRRAKLPSTSTTSARSAACTLDRSVFTSSPGWTATCRWATMAPASYSSSTRCTVTPVTSTPAARTAS